MAHNSGPNHTHDMPTKWTPVVLYGLDGVVLGRLHKIGSTIVVHKDTVYSETTRPVTPSVSLSEIQDRIKVDWLDGEAVRDHLYVRDGSNNFFYFFDMPLRYKAGLLPKLRFLLDDDKNVTRVDIMLAGITHHHNTDTLERLQNDIDTFLRECYQKTATRAREQMRRQLVVLKPMYLQFLRDAQTSTGKLYMSRDAMSMITEKAGLGSIDDPWGPPAKWPCQERKLIEQPTRKRPGDPDDSAEPPTQRPRVGAVRGGLHI